MTINNLNSSNGINVKEILSKFGPDFVKYLSEYGYIPEGDKKNPSGLIQKDDKNNYELNSNYKNVKFGPRPAYYNMPNIDDFENQLELASKDFDEINKLSGMKKHHDNNPESPILNDNYKKGIILSRLKFGESINKTISEILKNYPDKNSVGKLVAIQGLCGAGKSTIINELKSQYPDQIVNLDADTMRFNLFAEKGFKVDQEVGLDEYRKNALFSDTMSAILYAIINIVAIELKYRGYTCLIGSPRPITGTDNEYYIKHHKGIDANLIGGNLNDENKKDLVKALSEVTDKRVDGPDNFDWSNLKTEFNPDEMQGVSVQVPGFIHEWFADMMKAKLDKGIVKVENPYVQPGEKIDLNAIGIDELLGHLKISKISTEQKGKVDNILN